MVKLDTTPFGAGAMRECLAMKKLSSHTTHRDWKRALNLVAKRYKAQKTAAQVCGRSPYLIPSPFLSAASSHLVPRTCSPFPPLCPPH